MVGHPAAPPLEALYDVYCRFGNFAGANILQRKNYGYLYFTNGESAQKAISVSFVYYYRLMVVIESSNVLAYSFCRQLMTN